METLRNEPVILSGLGGAPAGPGYGYGHDGLLSTVLLASLLGGGNAFGKLGANAGVDIGSFFNEKSNADTRRDVKETESELRQSLYDQTYNTSNEFRSVSDKMFGLQSDALSAKYEGIIANKDTTNHLSNKVDRESDLTRKYISDTQVSMDKQFSDLKTELLNQMNAVEKRELNREIDELRRNNSDLKRDGQTSILEAILKAVTPTP